MTARATATLGLISAAALAATLGCRPTLNRLPTEWPTVSRVAVGTDGAPDIVVSIGTPLGDDFFDDAMTESAAATTEYELFDAFERSAPPKQMQVWFVSAFEEALFDGFPKLVRAETDTCDARIVVDLDRYGMVAANPRSVVHLTLRGEIRMLRCDDDNGIWRHPIDRSEPVHRGRRAGLTRSGGTAGQAASLDLAQLGQIKPADLAFLVERMSQGAAVSAVSAMKRDAGAKTDDTGEPDRP